MNQYFDSSINILSLIISNNNKIIHKNLNNLNKVFKKLTKKLC